MPHAPLPARWRNAFVAVLLAMGALWAAPPASAAPSQEPPLAPPPPPVTVQDVVNELLPLIRQLQPITNQVGPIVSELDPLVAGGAEFADQLATLAAQLEPFIAQVAPLSQAVGSALLPVWESVDTQITPELQSLLAVFGPYLNQVDLATAFQVIGPVAPTALKGIPVVNRFYDALDVLAPARDPITCPIARAVPQQKVLDIVVPFLCYDTIGAAAPISPGNPVAPSPPPAPANGATSQGEPFDTGAATEQAAAMASASPAPAAGSRTPAGVAPVAGARPAAAPAQAIGTTSDDRLEALEARLRLMMVLAGGIGMLLWNFFRQGANDDLGGLGAFRRARSDLPQPVA